MASGHVNRINRPNTWLHRPMLRREVLTCQPGAVHTWLHQSRSEGISFYGFSAPRRFHATKTHSGPEADSPRSRSRDGLARLATCKHDPAPAARDRRQRL